MPRPALDTAVDELYGVAPEDFVPTRTRLAKAAREYGDKDVSKQIGELRKPTLAAWALNRLVRERPVEIESLLDLGRRMRAAQGSLDVDAMRTLRGEREETLDAVTRAARFVADAAGHGLSVTAAAAVRATCVAALADGSAADALASGALVRTLDYAGFGEVDLDDAVATGAEVRSRIEEPPPSSDPGPSVHEALRVRLEEEVAAADRELARASLVEAEAARLAEKAERRAEELRRLLDAAESEVRDRVAAAEAARSERETAHRALDHLRARLDGVAGTRH